MVPRGGIGGAGPGGTRPRAGNLNARIYRSICLAETGRTQEAEIIKLVEIPAAAKNADLLTEYTQLLYETDRSGPALQRIDEALSISPRVSKQHLWRARIVLGLSKERKPSGSRLKPYARNLLVKSTPQRAARRTRRGKRSSRAGSRTPGPGA